MNLIEKATILHYHRHRIHQFQPGGVEALGWRGPESQSKRFEALLQVGDFTGRTVLDIGCGYGDLKGFLDRHCPDFTYIGIDQMPEFIEEAKARYEGLLDTYFFRRDFTQAQLPQVDYVIASGAFGYRFADAGHYFRMVRKLFGAAKSAFAFNMLDGAVFPPHDLLTGHERSEVTAFCRSLTSRVEVVSGYLEDDFTVFMYRDAPHGSQAAIASNAAGEMK
ncbi:MAG TPA: class I SAM-dependent methyltransferase [Candidatus Angelobacter sp.]|nr:class I SAM-dependent methyltransferase [Candidatus Angelobacter sp.]